MASPLASTPPPLPIARFSVEQYHRMIASGAFTEHDDLELIEGWVVRKMAKGPGYEYATGVLEDFLRAHVPRGWHVRNQAPVTLARSEPEPDLAVVRGARGDYRSGHPSAGDAALVIEVADTSVAVDRLKGQSYGQAAIPEYWLVNLPDRCIEVYTDASGEEQTGYATCTELGDGDELALVIDGRRLGSLSVAGVLP